MKTKTAYFRITTMIFLMVVLASSQALPQRLTGSRSEASETREITGFDAVKAGGAFDIYLTQGAQYHVEVVADDNLLDYVVTEVRGGVLEVSMKPRVSLRRFKTLEVHITAPQFTSIQASGACDIFTTNLLQGEALKVRASGASDVRINLEVDYLSLECSGASDATLSGSAQEAQVRFSGSSDLKGRELVCGRMHLRMSGSSDAYVNVKDQVSGTLSGSSDLKIKGRPEVDVRTSGSSSVSSGA